MEDHNVDAGRVQPPEHASKERRLARGLEDVSELFLSQAAGEAAAGVQPGNGPAEQAFFTLLHPLSLENRSQLISLFEEHAAVLEEGMRSLDANIPCDPFGPIDLLAVDRANRLVIVDIDASARDELLMRAIAHFDWLARNVDILRRMYRGRVIDYSSKARLFLIAPDYSPLLKCVTRWIPCPQISCFKYHAVAIRNGSGIFLERA